MIKQQNYYQNINKICQGLSGFQLAFAVKTQLMPNKVKFVPTHQMWQISSQ